MEAWSDLPVREPFRIKFYLDTNILSYLVDNTYSGLTLMMTYLKNSEFADLVSSKYVIFEFVGIRKREHYLQKVLQKSTSAVGKVNISSLLKYKDRFNAPEVKFEDVQPDIKHAVETEVHEITDNFGIDYNTNILHDTLLFPTFEINLSSRLSREDSLVLTSAVWIDSTRKEKFVLIASNDQDFFDSYDENLLRPIFAKHGLTPPIVEHLKDLKLQNSTKVDLTMASDDVKLTSFLPSKLKELIIERNKTIFLGKTIHCGNGVGFPTNVVCFNLLANTELRNNIYLTIIGKDLDFIYSTKLPVAGFYDQVSIENYPFQKDVATNISFRPMEKVGEAVIPIAAEIVTRLRETGNLVFINPDSIE
jgi:hypothetical protein